MMDKHRDMTCAVVGVTANGSVAIRQSAMMFVTRRTTERESLQKSWR